MRWLSRIAVGLITQVITGQRHPFFVVKPNHEDLLVLKELIETGKARPVIERSYTLSEVASALRQVGEGRGQGQTVIRVAAS
jgi:NADPH:quinone reductase-like Zn-dependent oxidoreductase